MTITNGCLGGLSFPIIAGAAGGFFIRGWMGALIFVPCTIGVVQCIALMRIMQQQKLFYKQMGADEKFINAETYGTMPSVWNRPWKLYGWQFIYMYLTALPFSAVGKFISIYIFCN